MKEARAAMSSVDLAWLRMDRPTNPMVIVGVLTCRERIHYSALARLLETRLLRFARFRERPAFDVMGAHWAHDPDFRLSRHLRRAKLPPRAGQVQLEALVSRLASTALDPEHPLWRIDLVEHFGAGSALVFRFHHCYADGAALLHVFLSLTDAAPTATAEAPPLERTDAAASNSYGVGALLGSTLSLAQSALDGAADALAASLRALAHPQQTLQSARELGAAAEELARISTMSDDPPTALRGALGRRKQAAWGEPIPLAEAKTIARALGGTINDVLLSTLAGALGAYLERCDAAPEAGLRALVPVNLRPPEAKVQLGNYFGLVFAGLPVGERNPLARFFAVHDDMEALKQSPQPQLALWLLTAMGAVPAAFEHQAVELFTRKASLVISNVPGPRQPLYLAGSRIEQQHFWVPQAGGIGVGASLLTYDGAVHFGLIADRELIPEPAQLTRLFAEEFDKLVLCVAALAGAEPPAREAARSRGEDGPAGA